MTFLRTFYQTRKRVRQRATRFSLIVVIMLFGLFFEAYMHNFNLVYITLFFVFAVAMSVTMPGVFNVGNLRAEFSRCSRLFAHQEGRCFFQLTNPSKTHSYALTIACDQSSTSVRRIASGATQSIALAITPQKRGRYRCEPCRIESLFPLSTVRFELPVEHPIETIVYPEPKGEPLRDFLMCQQAHFGEEQDFDGLKNYSGNEPISRIHWPSVAKGEPAVKQFMHERQTETLIFDFQRCASDDESRLSQLCLWVVECEQLNAPFEVRMPHKSLSSKKESIDAILETLALY